MKKTTLKAVKISQGNPFCNDLSTVSKIRHSGRNCLFDPGFLSLSDLFQTQFECLSFTWSQCCVGAGIIKHHLQQILHELSLRGKLISQYCDLVLQYFHLAADVDLQFGIVELLFQIRIRLLRLFRFAYC